jgi:hypothetical protein
MTEKKSKYLRELAESFVNVDWRVQDHLHARAAEIAGDMPNGDIPFVYGMLHEGAVLFKYAELVSAYEKVKEEADNA